MRTLSTHLILMFSLYLACSSVALGQGKVPRPTQPESTKRDFCFNVVKPGMGGCPVGENIPYETPLLEAIRQRDLVLVKRLIAEGVNVNQFDSQGISPLFLVSNGDLELIDILLKAGADVNAESKYGGTPLSNSTMCSLAVRKFLEAGAEVNRKNINGKTALMAAAEGGNLTSVNLLLNAGAKVQENDIDEMTPLLYAIKSQHFDIVRLFNSKFEDRQLLDDKVLDKAMYFAVLNSQIDLVRLLLDKGASIEGLDRKNGTPLGNAVQKDNVEIVKLLLERGAEVNHKNGYSPIYWAALKGNASNVRLLVEADAEVDEPRFSNSWTPLIAAARNEHIEAMQLLIKAGADIDRRAYDGKTALMYAVWERRVKSIKFLIESGADVNLRDEDDDVTALSTLTKGASASDFTPRDKEIIRLLRDAGGIE